MAKKTLPGFTPKPEMQAGGECRFDWVEDAQRESAAHARQLAAQRVSDGELARSLDGLARSCDAASTARLRVETKGLLFKKEVRSWEQKPEWVQDRDAYLAEQSPKELARSCLRGLFGRSVDRMSPGMMAECCDTKDDFMKVAEALGGLTATVDAAANGPEPVTAGVDKGEFFDELRDEMRSAYRAAEKAGYGPEFMSGFMLGADKSKEYLSLDSNVSALIRGYMPETAVSMMSAMEQDQAAVERERAAGKARWDFGPAPVFDSAGQPGPSTPEARVGSSGTRRGIPDYIGPQESSPGREESLSL